MGKIYRTDSSGNPTLIVQDGVVDTTLSTTSTNAIANKVVTENFNAINENLIDLKMLGWSVPSDCPIQNSVSGNTFTQNVGRVDLGSLTWDYDTSMAQFKTTISDIKNVTKNLYCIKYTVTNSTSWTGIANNEMGNLSGTNFRIKNTSYTDATAFKSAMNGVYLYYELATPITMAIDGNEVVSEIKNDLSANSYGENAGGKNLLDEATYITSSGYSVYYHLKLKPNTNYIMSTPDFPTRTAAPLAAMFFISGNVESGASSDTTGVFGDIPRVAGSDSDGYVTFVYRTIVNGGTTYYPQNYKWQIEEGSTATDYEPYISSNYQLTEDVAEINSSLSNVLTDLKKELKTVYHSVSSSSATFTYTMKTSDFTNYDGIGHYLVLVTTWSANPSTSIAVVAFSGGSTSNSNVTYLVQGTPSISVASGVISTTNNGGTRIIAMNY